MSRIERGIPPEIDLSIDPAVINQARLLLRVEPNLARSQGWLQSQDKRKREKFLSCFLLACTSPALAVSGLSVLVADGRPLIHKETIAFLGPGGERINPVPISKIRSLKRGSHLEKRNPFATTVFKGGREKKREAVDPRVHSIVGAILRKIGFDEIPQLFDIIQGRTALIGPRGYTLREIEGLEVLFEVLGHREELRDYLQIMAEVRPRPGLGGLYAAIRKKDLTVIERLILDQLYCLCATRQGDNRILIASFSTTAKMTGLR